MYNLLILSENNEKIESKYNSFLKIYFIKLNLFIYNTVSVVASELYILCLGEHPQHRQRRNLLKFSIINVLTIFHNRIVCLHTDKDTKILKTLIMHLLRCGSNNVCHFEHTTILIDCISVRLSHIYPVNISVFYCFWKR